MRCTLEYLRQWVHWLVLAAAAMLCIPTFAYRFGRDQALFHYIGREWLRGLVPYRDAFDHKPPLIYVVHALGVASFGCGQWVIRLFDSCALLLLGWASVRLACDNASRNGNQVAHGFFLSCVFYYIYFDYWDTAQVELWEALFVVLALVAVRDTGSSRWAYATGGLLFAVACLFKLTAVTFAPLLALVLGQRALTGAEPGKCVRRMLHAALLATLGMLVPILLVVAGFGAAGGLRDLWDVVIGFNSYYAAHKRTADYSGLAAFLLDHNAMPTLLCFGALLVAWLRVRRLERPNWDPLLLALGGYLLAIVSVVTQGKFYWYHWTLLVPFETTMILLGLQSLGEGARLRRALVLAAMLGVTLITAPVWGSNSDVTYPRYVKAWTRWASGRNSQAGFSRLFIGCYGYSYAALEAIGRVVEETKRPGDLLQVHGFEPIPYVISGLRSPSRFFAEHSLLDPELAYKRSEWLSEHERALAANPPRFIVDFDDQWVRIHQRISAGYRPSMQAAQYVLLVKESSRDGTELP